jgi:plasmid stabilization system protein ParE
MSETENLVDALAEAWIARKKEVEEAQSRLDAVVAECDKLAGTPEKIRGTMTLAGDKFKIKVERRQNVTYDDAKLASFLKDHPELAGMFKVKLSESGSKVWEYVDDASVPQQVREDLRAIRTVKTGKTGVSVVA